jgi:sulfatase modifying factor 1
MRIHPGQAAAAACVVTSLFGVPSLANTFTFGTGPNQFNLEFVPVGDPGNAADTTGYGAVSESFQISKFEFTNQQYTNFLNSVDPDGNNPNAVYSLSQGSDARGGISFTSGAASGSKYATKSNMGDKPVNFITWFDAARVSNWLMNGATGTSSMETGAYTLNNATSGTAPARNSGATFYIPTEDQWYKAAYYRGGGTNAGYWSYATQSNTSPATVNATTVGIGTTGGVSPVTSGNFANSNFQADWNGQDGNVTTVGTNGGASAYGVADMNGNVSEWNDLTGTADSVRGVRGGGWRNQASTMVSTTRFTPPPSDTSTTFGIRLAYSEAVPGPLPLFGAAAAYGWSRQLRKRIKLGSSVTPASKTS